MCGTGQLLLWRISVWAEVVISKSLHSSYRNRIYRHNFEARAEKPSWTEYVKSWSPYFLHVGVCGTCDRGYLTAEAMPATGVSCGRLGENPSDLKRHAHTYYKKELLAPFVRWCEKIDTSTQKFVITPCGQFCGFKEFSIFTEPQLLFKWLKITL